MTGGLIVEGTGYAPVTPGDDVADLLPLFDQEDAEFFLRPIVRRSRSCS